LRRRSGSYVGWLSEVWPVRAMDGEERIGLVPGKWAFEIPRMTLYGSCAGICMGIDSVFCYQFGTHLIQICHPEGGRSTFL